MSTPNTPTLALLALNQTSFRATLGSDAGALNTLYYQQVGIGGTFGTPSVGGTLTGPGILTLSGLQANKGYLAWAVSDNGSLSLPAIATVNLATTDTLSGAIVAAFQSDPSLLAICPLLQANEIPETDINGSPVFPPFGVVKVDEEAPEWGTESQYIGWTEMCKSTITFYAQSQQLVDQIAAAFQSDFDFHDLPFTTSKTVCMMRERSRIGVEELQDSNGERVFTREIDYTVMVGRVTALTSPVNS